MRVAIGALIGCMMRDPPDGAIRGPFWDPAGQVPFRTWVREVHSWLNVTSGRCTSQQQAAALQRGLEGLARVLAMRIPSNNKNFGAEI